MLPEANPYTDAIANCLAQLPEPLEPEKLDHSTVQFLTNMIQGRMLQHFIARIAHFYQIDGEALHGELTTLLVDVFSEELFAKFRQRVEQNPGLICEIAKRIVEVEKSCENEAGEGNEAERINRLYVAIFRKYLEYDNLDVIIETLQSNPRIQKLILSAILKKKINFWLGSWIRHLVHGDRWCCLTRLVIFWRKILAFLGFKPPRSSLIHSR